jgi:hypothetical protein
VKSAVGEDRLFPSQLHRFSIFLLIWVLAFPAARPLRAAELKPETVKAWDQYLQWADARVKSQISDPKVFLIQNTLSPDARAALQKQLSAGEIISREMPEIIPSGNKFHVPAGEIHHWWGSVLIRNVTLSRLIQFLQDYDHHGGKFSDVERAQLLSRDENHYRIFMRLRRSKAFVTAYYNTEQECFYAFYGPTRAFSRSIATKIAELDNPGTPAEHEKAPGNDRGFLWRLASWWRFEQIGGDVLVELESASLSRDIPTVIKFMPGISSYIRSTPRETLESVLASIRKAVASSQ